MLSQKGNTKSWFKIGIEEFLCIKADTITMDDVGLRLDTLEIDFFPFRFTITQQNGAQVTFAIDFILAQFAFTVSLGRGFRYE